MRNKIEFVVEGEPNGKARPRFARVYDGVSVRTPKGTKEYEQNIKATYLEQCGNII